MRCRLFRTFLTRLTGRQDRRSRVRSTCRMHNRLGLLDSLESRVLLSGFGPAPAADVMADPMGAPAQSHQDRFAWSLSPGTSAQVSVFVRDDAASPFTSDQRSRIDDAITELNRGWDAVRGVGLKLVPVLEDSQAHIVVAQDSASGCGSRQQGVLGCGEYFVYAAPSGQFANGDDLHRFAGPEVGLHAQVTLIAGWNWFTGGEPNQITTEQFDFTTVVTHELAHAVGLDHDSGDTHSDSSTQEPLNGDGESALAPTLAQGETHRKLSDDDVAELQFLYASEASAEATTASDSAADQSSGDEPTGDPTDPSDDACEASDPDAPQNEGVDGDQQDDDCDTEGENDPLEGEPGTQQPEVVFIEPSRADAVALTPSTTVAAAFGAEESVREQRIASRQTATATPAIPQTEPTVREIAKRLNSETNADFGAAVPQALEQTEVLASGLAAPGSQFKTRTAANASGEDFANPNRTLLAQVFNTLFADRIARARSEVSSGVSAGNRAESASAIDTAGLGLTAVLIGGLWGAQATEPKQPKWQFLLDHLLDRSN